MPALPVDLCYVQLAEPVPYQTFQRDSMNRADIPVSGQCSCEGDRMEARWGESAFEVIDSLVEGNRFSGVLAGRPAGQGRLEVRCAGATACSAEAEYVGIGEVFVIAGQSNASGRADILYRFEHPELKATVFSDNDEWREANDPLHTLDRLAKGSVWPLVADFIMLKLGVPVGFIATARGGTGLVADGNWRAVHGYRFRSMVAQVGKSGVNAVRAVLFFQGERDISQGIPEQDYFRELAEFARVTRDTLPGKPHILIGQTGFYGPKGKVPETIDAIRFAQSRVWDSLDYVFPGPVTYDLAPLGDGLHFKEDKHVRKLSERWWSAIEAVISGARQRGPGIAEVFTGRDNQTVFARFHHTGMSLVSDNPSAGFRITDGAREFNIIGARILEPDTVELILDLPLISDVVVVSFGSGNVSGSLYAGGDLLLPAEPFTRVATAWIPEDRPEAFEEAMTPDPSDHAEVRPGLPEPPDYPRKRKANRKAPR